MTVTTPIMADALPNEANKAVDAYETDETNMGDEVGEA
jgi:hypothetical protein